MTAIAPSPSPSSDDSFKSARSHQSPSPSPSNVTVDGYKIVPIGAKDDAAFVVGRISHATDGLTFSRRPLDCIAREPRLLGVDAFAGDRRSHRLLRVRSVPGVDVDQTPVSIGGTVKYHRSKLRTRSLRVIDAITNVDLLERLLTGRVSVWTHTADQNDDNDDNVKDAGYSAILGLQYIELTFVRGRLQDADDGKAALTATDVLGNIILRDSFAAGVPIRDAATNLRGYYMPVILPEGASASVDTQQSFFVNTAALDTPPLFVSALDAVVFARLVHFTKKAVDLYFVQTWPLATRMCGDDDNDDASSLAAAYKETPSAELLACAPPIKRRSSDGAIVMDCAVTSSVTIVKKLDIADVIEQARLAWDVDTQFGSVY